MASQMELAQHLDLSARHVRTLIAEGVLPPRGADGYALDTARVAYIRHLRSVAAGRGAGALDLAAERAILARHQSERVSMQNAIRRGQFVEIEEVGRQVESEYAVIRERTLCLPGACAGLCAGLDRVGIEVVLNRYVDAMLSELSAPAEIAKRALEKAK